MRNLAHSFTMRKDGVLPHGDWFTIVNKDDEPPQVYIYDEIGFWGTDAADFVKQLQEIDAKLFHLHLNSPGGEVFDGIAIYNAVKRHKAEVEVYVDGLAASAASFIAQAGDKVIMARNAEMMIHDGIAFAYGNEQDMLDVAALLGDVSNNIADIYAYRSGKRDFDDATVEHFRGLMREETWYTGKEAVEGGLADVVLDQDDEEAEKAKNKWDLSFYNHAGRGRAESPLRIAARLKVQNRPKENDMPKGPQNNGPEAPESQPGAPTTDEPGGQPTGDPEEPGTEVPPEGDPTPPGTQPEQQPPPADRQGVLINGKLETDWTKINAHLASLTNAQNEQRDVHRKTYIEQLATDKKIPASQIDGLLKMVLGDEDIPGLTDEQWAAFEASYGSAPASQLFDEHAGPADKDKSAPGGPYSPPQLTAKEKEDRISILEGTVAMHERAMGPEKAKETKSYKELQELRAASNNS